MHIKCLLLNRISQLNIFEIRVEIMSNVFVIISLNVKIRWLFLIIQSLIYLSSDVVSGHYDSTCID